MFLIKPTTLDLGRGEPVLALHSSMSSKSQWRTLGELVGERHRVLAIDLHGYGSQPMPAPGRPFGLEDEVELATRRAAEAFGTRVPMHVVAHSYGAAVALSLARQRPELVRSLALYEPVCFGLLDREGPGYSAVRRIAERVAGHVRAGELSQAARVFLEYWGGRDAYDRWPPETRAHLDRLVAKVPVDFEALLSAPSAASWYAGIDAPTLLMTGTASTESARTIAKALWAAMPRSTLVELQGDHLLPLSDPAAVNRHVARFLATFPAERRPVRMASIL